MKRPPREAGALHIYVVVNVVVLCTHTHESGALLRFFLVGKKKKKKAYQVFPRGRPGLDGLKFIISVYYYLWLSPHSPVCIHIGTEKFTVCSCKCWFKFSITVAHAWCGTTQVVVVSVIVW